MMKVMDVSSLPSEALARDYWELLKPRVMSLVIFTGGIGMVLSPTLQRVHPFLLFVALLCLAVGAGAAAVFNMVGDADIDALMDRTRQRPLPSGRVESDKALVFGILLAFFSVGVMGISINIKASALLAFTIFFYSVVYTLGLKRRTPQNIVIGGASGALPPLIGWVSASGDFLAPLPWILFLIIFLWTPPHFWALALYRPKEYAQAKIPMMPCVVGERRTIKQIGIYTFLLLVISFLPWLTRSLGFFYGVSAIVLGGYFALSVGFLFVKGGKAHGGILFRDSILYLFLLFLSMAIDRGLF
jgi:protoheme IX farnesyltransferase